MPSLTRPDMSLTVKELLRNHARGISSNISINEGMYFDTVIPKPMDLVEQMEYKQSLIGDYNALEELSKKERTELSKQKKEQAEALKKAKIEELRKFLKDNPEEFDLGESKKH